MQLYDATNNLVDSVPIPDSMFFSVCMALSLEALLGPALLIQVLVLFADGIGFCTLFGNASAVTVEWQCNCHCFL